VGIKNVHIALISCSTLAASLFGLWCLNNHYTMIGMVSFGAAVGLVVYGISFLKKVSKL
jgi:hypothetical protein